LTVVPQSEARLPRDTFDYTYILYRAGPTAATARHRSGQHPAAAAAAAAAGPRATDVLPLLGEQLAVLSGGRDRRGGAVITFPVSFHQFRLNKIPRAKSGRNQIV
jgi:hypothetical protein